MIDSEKFKYYLQILTEVERFANVQIFKSFIYYNELINPKDINLQMLQKI